MHHFIATDEAGYGPNLGPLVIGATAWSSLSEDGDFRAALKNVAFESRGELKQFERESGRPGIMIADSKAVYSGGRLELLERGVLACVAAVHGRIPATVGELLQLLNASTKPVEGCGFFDFRQKTIPVVSESGVVESVAELIAGELQANEMVLRCLSAAVVFPQQFNEGTAKLGNKASYLTAESLYLVKKAQLAIPANVGDQFDIRCDKHGGRNHYEAAIRNHYEDTCVAVVNESRECSRYLLTEKDASIEFRAKGEAWLPIALSSMIAKYVRELSMEHWNGFWIQHLPHLKGTKGYPADARRFKSEIQTTQQRLGISDDEIWRKK